METLCPQCGASLTCKKEAGCWCAELPNLLPVPDPGPAACLCLDCLVQKLEAQVALIDRSKANK